jgi:hypothetical protein
MSMVSKKALNQQHTAAEVAALTPEGALEVRKGGAGYQRGAPERAMNKLQKESGGGVLSSAAEHVGDLTHRMNEGLSTGITMETTMPKIVRQHDNLHSAYGFEREHNENIRSNAQFRGIPESQHRAAVEGASQSYAAEHKKVPVYNYPSEVARDAAVSLGEGRFDDTRKHLRNLQTMQFGGRDTEGSTWAEGDMESLLHVAATPEHQQGMVDYLRDREANTPAITNAATVMLGGRIKNLK